MDSPTNVDAVARGSTPQHEPSTRDFSSSSSSSHAAPAEVPPEEYEIVRIGKKPIPLDFQFPSAPSDAGLRQLDTAEAQALVTGLKDVQAGRVNSLAQIDADAGLRALVEDAKWLRKFVEYARYELEPGTQQPGDQFPRQDAADRAIGLIDKMIDELSALLTGERRDA